MITRTALTTLTTALAAIATGHAQQREPGLLIRLYDVGQNMRWLPEIAQGELPNRVLVVPTLDLRTARDDFAPLKEHFATDVAGYLTITEPGAYTLRLISDDGAKLWLDGRLLIDHDGHHGPTPKDGKLELTAGEHQLRIAHFNNYGDGALALNWRQPGAAGDSFELVPADVLSHATGVSRETTPGKKRIIPALRRGLPGDGTPVAGTHPSFDYVLLVTPMLGLQSPSVACSKLRIRTTASGLDETSLILLPVGDSSGDDVRFAFLSDLRDPDRRWTADDGSPAFDPCTVSHVAADGAQTLWRVVPDDVDGFLQGCVFRFAAGFPARIIGLDGAIPNAVVVWFDTSGRAESSRRQALCFMRPNERITFEAYAVRAMTNGFEIEFTKPLDPRCGWDPESYYVEQWPFNLKSQISNPLPPRRDGIRYPVKSASVSPDRKKVFLEIENLKESHVVYIRLLPPCVSEDGERPWSTEAWYTLNALPKDRFGKVLTPPTPEPQNFLTAEEQAAGWKLLFDGKTTAGWRGYKKQDFPDGWIVKDGCLVRVGSAGDIITQDEFDNFELTLEWRICAAGNSGIFYRVNEDHDWPFFTGPEMQVLDNAEHADGRNPKTSAGSNYALYAPVRDVTRPVGFFNQVRIVADGPHIEHWLNGVKVAEYELGSSAWEDLVAASKFAKWPEYGRVRKGHIVLQDHGDRVWYRNMKIRPRGGD